MKTTQKSGIMTKTKSKKMKQEQHMTMRRPKTKKLLMAFSAIMLFASPFIPTSSAYAACSSPTGEEGEQVYNVDHKVMQYCDGTDWTAMRDGSGSGSSLASQMGLDDTIWPDALRCGYSWGDTVAYLWGIKVNGDVEYRSAGDFWVQYDTSGAYLTGAAAATAIDDCKNKTLAQLKSEDRHISIGGGNGSNSSSGGSTIIESSDGYPTGMVGFPKTISCVRSDIPTRAAILIAHTYDSDTDTVHYSALSMPDTARLGFDGTTGAYKDNGGNTYTTNCNVSDIRTETAVHVNLGGGGSSSGSGAGGHEDFDDPMYGGNELCSTTIGGGTSLQPTVANQFCQIEGYETGVVTDISISTATRAWYDDGAWTSGGCGGKIETVRCFNTGGGSGGASTSSGESTSIFRDGWPDAIRCNEGTQEYYLYYRTENPGSNETRYGLPSVGSSARITFNTDTKTYKNKDNISGTASCLRDIADYISGGDAFYFGGGSGSGGSTDDLGDHTATQALDMATFDIENAGSIELETISGANAPTGGSGLWTATGADLYRTAGNVGIGTASPQTVLHAEAPSSTTMQLGRTGYATGARLGFTDGALNFFMSSDSGSTFPNLGLAIKGDGNVGIGTASTSYKLHVAGTAYATGAAGALSDKRHKTNIEPIEGGALDLINALRPVTFDWKNPLDKGMEGTQLGFIAQELEKIIPSMVLTQPNNEKTKGVKSTELLPVLTKAVQELSFENQKLKDSIVKLSNGGITMTDLSLNNSTPNPFEDTPPWLLIVLLLQGLAIIGLGIFVIKLNKRKK